MQTRYYDAYKWISIGKLKFAKAAGLKKPTSPPPCVNFTTLSYCLQKIHANRLSSNWSLYGSVISRETVIQHLSFLDSWYQISKKNWVFSKQNFTPVALNRRYLQRPAGMKSSWAHAYAFNTVYRISIIETRSSDILNTMNRKGRSESAETHNYSRKHCRFNMILKASY